MTNLPSLRELQNLMIVGAVAADPHEAFGIDVDAMLGIRPLVARRRVRPTREQLGLQA